MRYKILLVLILSLSLISVFLPEAPLSCEKGSRFFKGTDTFVNVLNMPDPEIDPTTRHMYIRGVEMLSVIEATDARVKGTMTFTMNANMDLTTNIGPLWGGFKIEVSGGGLWEGGYIAERAYVGHVKGKMTWRTTINYSGFGKGGNLEGHQVQMTEVIYTDETHDQNDPSFVGTLKGFVLETRD
jgi:hypothetical protein